MKALFLRVFVETSNGGYYSPIIDDCYVALPIPETTKIPDPPDHMLPDKIIDKCTGRTLDHYYPLELTRNNHPVHNDPRLDLGFYTDYYMPIGRIPKKNDKKLSKNDVIIFMAGFAYYPQGFFESKHTLRDIRKEFMKAHREGKTGIYIMGYIVIKDMVNVEEIGWRKAIQKYPVLRYSPHYYRQNDKPLAIIGKGYILANPIKIYSKSQGISPVLKKIIGGRQAVSMARNNFRRSSVVNINEGIFYEYIDQSMD